jgi:hypothetical protein
LDWEKITKVLDTTHRQGLDKDLTLAEAKAVINLPQARSCTLEEAVAYSQFMSEAMPTGHETNAKIWVEDATLIFCDYAVKDVDICVKHPIKGIRSKLKWLPEPSDLIKFLDEMKCRRARIIGNAKYLVRQAEEKFQQDARDAEYSRIDWDKRKEQADKILKEARIQDVNQ